MTAQPAADTREALAAAAEAIRLLLETLGNSRPKKDLPALYQRQAMVEKMSHEALAKITEALSPAVKPISAEEWEVSNVLAEEIFQKYVKSKPIDAMPWKDMRVKIQQALYDAHQRGLADGKTDPDVHNEASCSQAVHKSNLSSRDQAGEK